jgi:hypothetical protein
MHQIINPTYFKTALKILLSFTLLLALLTPDVKAVNNIIYLDEDTKINKDYSPINLSSTQVNANGTDKVEVAFSLYNSNKKIVTKDIYTVTINTNNGSLSQLIRNDNGQFRTTFTAPKSGSQSNISVTIKYRYFACNNVEELLLTLTQDEKKYYVEAGFSIVNIKASQVQMNLTNTEVQDIIQLQADSMMGIDYADTVGFAKKLTDLNSKLDCANIDTTQDLNAAVVYTNNPLYQIPAIASSQTYTPRTGGQNNNQLFISVSILSLITIILLRIRLSSKRK